MSAGNTRVNFAVLSLYDPSTGILTGQTVSGSPAIVALNIPKGAAAIEGEHDHLSKRVDLATRQVVDWQPPQPSPDHEWNAETRRWQPTAAAITRQEGRQAALARIAALEAGTIRTLRDAALGIPGAHDRLAAVEAEIAQHRATLAATQP
jgi:hypothetical protein